MADWPDTTEFDLDRFLTKLGRFGKFQFINYVLLSFAVMATSAYTVSYVFTAGIPKYRCRIPECDVGETPQYSPDWLPQAVPFKENLPSQCFKFHTEFTAEITTPETCLNTIFNASRISKCDAFVFDSDHTTIAHEFNLYCEENLWKLTSIGTINNVGQFICMPLTGFFSDKFGRRSTIVLFLVGSAFFGLVRSFATNYIWFALSEFFEQCIGAGVYGSVFLLASELVGPKERVFGGTLICCSFAIGEAVLGLIAWYVKSWQVLLRVMYAPGLLFIFYMWSMPESVRWLLTQRKYAAVEKAILRAANLNKLKLDKSEIYSLMTSKATPDEMEKLKRSGEYVNLLSSPTMFFRFVNCSVCWIFCTFVFYGLSLNSVSIEGTIYLNFIFVSIAEIPAYLLSMRYLDTIGRRLCLSASFVLSGGCCLIFIFLSEDMGWMRLIFFFVGKCAITMSFTVMYVYTMELFPTSIRHSMLGICGMFGRIGSAIAPQTPLLATLWNPLPLVLFGGTAMMSGILALAFPETLNTELSNTVDEAKKIGQKPTLA